MKMMLVVQAVMKFSFDPSLMGRSVDWAVQDVLSCASGSRKAENHAKCVQCGQTGRWRPDWSLESIKRKIMCLESDWQHSQTFHSIEQRRKGGPLVPAKKVDEAEGRDREQVGEEVSMGK